jgi:hypothetical protein
MRAPVALLALVFSCGCATLPEPTGGEEGLPNAGAGPFRALVKGEIGNGRGAPNALNDSNGYARDIAVIDLDGDPKTLGVAAFLAVAVPEGGAAPTRDSPTRAIQRFGALDGRSFDHAAAPVLAPDAAWEGSLMGSPAALRKGGEVWLYYAAAGGIGLARGDATGTTFTKLDAPVLAVAESGWDAGIVPQSPGVVLLADGSVRLFYQVDFALGSAVGEAKSADGIHFERVGDGPALTRGIDAGDAGDAGDLAYDGAGCGSPFPVLATGGDGSTILRLYYGALDHAGTRTIGLAARYGESGAFQKAVGPVFGAGKPLGPREPCVVPFDGFSLIYATERSSTSSQDPVIAAGIAPATAKLPPPDPL